LELARLYGYLYQNTNKQYSIIHALDGYDEISMTGDFKVINNQGENYYNMEELGFTPVLPQELAGGDSVAEAAQTFLSILNNTGTDIQNNVVLTNAAFAIKTFHPEKSFGD